MNLTNENINKEETLKEHLIKVIGDISDEDAVFLSVSKKGKGQLETAMHGDVKSLTWMSMVFQKKLIESMMNRD